jgi:hypothetical protein
VAVLGYDTAPHTERFPQLGTLDAELIALESDTFLIPEPLRTAAHPAFVMGRASNVAVRRALLDGLSYHTGAQLNEGIDFWYRVLKAAVHEGARVGLITAPLIRFRILDDSLSHRLVANWRELEVPPSLLRYADSGDAEDQRFAAMLARRWVDHARFILANPAQWRDFCHHHAVFLARWGVVDTGGTP